MRIARASLCGSSPSPIWRPGAAPATWTSRLTSRSTTSSSPSCGGDGSSAELPLMPLTTLLWQRLVADVEANAPWQRLRRSLLFLLQLLLVIVLVLLAARPFVERPA